MALMLKNNGEWEEIPEFRGILTDSSITMPLPPDPAFGSVTLYVRGSTCAYNVPYHSLSYYYADDHQMVTVLTPEVTGISCPHCGAPVRLVNGRGKCNYCESFI